MRFLPFALFLLSATPNVLVVRDTCACGSTCTCKHETEAVLKEGKKFEGNWQASMSLTGTVRM